MVRLVRGEVQERASDLLRVLLPLLSLDPQLKVSDVMPALFQTETHIRIRFEYFKIMPFALFSICKRYNSAGYIREI